MMTDEEIDSLVKKYNIFEYWTENVDIFPDKIKWDKIDDFVKKILELKQKYSEIEIHSLGGGGMYGSSGIEILRLTKKTPEELRDEILREIEREQEYLEESEDCAIGALKRIQKEYPNLKVTFTSSGELNDKDND